MLHHSMATKLCHIGRVSCGVSIILGPALLRDWEMSGKPPSITSAPKSDFLGLMIVVTLCFLNRSNKIADTFHKSGKGGISIFLAPTYHPVDHEGQERFDEEMASFYNSIPQNAELLSGQDVNYNIGIRSKMF